MLDRYTFSIADCEYLMRRNKDVLIEEIKEPYSKMLNKINELKKELDSYKDTDNDETIELKEKLLKYTSTIDYTKIPILDTSKLFGMFISTIMKLKRDYNVSYMICAFDKTPYYHSAAIENYKADRYNSTEVSKELEEELKNPELSDIDRKLISWFKSQADWDTANFWQYQTVKKSFIEKDKEKWADAGIHTICLRGFEADELAAYMSTLISKKHKENNNVTCMLAASDKDWTNFVGPGVEFVSIWTGNLKDRQYGNLKEEWEQFHKQYKYFAKHQKIKEDWKDITRYDYGILTELFIKSHNNATLFEAQEDDFRDYLIEKNLDLMVSKCEEKGEKPNKRILRPIAKYAANVELFFRIKNGCKHKKFLSYDVMKNAYTAMNVLKGKTVDIGSDSEGKPYCEKVGVKYTELLEPLCMSTLKNCNKYKQGTMINLCEQFEFNINRDNYKLYTASLMEKK